MIRLFKLAFISIIILFIIATGISLMIPSHIRISKAINIKSERDSVLSLIRDQHKWSTWYPAFMQMESNKQIQPVKVTMLQQNDSEVVARLQQVDKRPFINGWTVYEHATADSLTLQWYMDFKLAWYPWQKFGSLFYENLYGTMMQQGLENIRNIEQGTRNNE